MFRKWCRSEGFCNSSNLSHVLMDGGVLSVPFDRLNDFYEKYVEAIKNKEKIFVVEQKTPTYNFFVDLDYKDEDELTIDQLKDVCRFICDRVKKYGGGEAIVSVAEPKSCGEGLIKHGIHINWKNFVVDRDSAMALRGHIISGLSRIYSSKNWEDIVDLSVYGGTKGASRGSGFRMPWSHKRAKHEECQGRGCELCEKGKITQGMYVPLFKYTSGPFPMLMEIDKEPSVDMLWAVTLRTQETNFVTVEGATRKEGTLTAAQMKNELEDSTICQEIQTFIRKNMDDQSNMEVTKIYVHKNHYLVSSNSKYCENLKREHSSNHVWFHIDNNTIVQKCFCRCETNRGRYHGFCKDFSGRRHFLSSKILRLLYEDKVPTYNIKNVQVKPGETESLELLQKYIQKYIISTDITLKNINREKSKGKYTVHSEYICSSCNTENVQFSIDKKTIRQVCKCKTRQHILIDKIVNTLK